MPDYKLKERMNGIMKSLEKGIRDVFESGRYEAYLDTMSRFHRYSVNNTLLIYLQKPDATLVAGYRSWQERFGRNVKKGEKSIHILAPCPVKQEMIKDVYDENLSPVLDSDGNPVQEHKEVILPAFKPVPVFDVSQTEGEPIPSIVKPLDGSVEDFEEMMETLRRVSPVPITFLPLPGAQDGYYSPGEQKIVLRTDMGNEQTVCAAIHEITHALLHTKIGEKSPATMEVEAESVAYTVCKYFGIETGENSFGYIAAWSKDREVPQLKSSLETITRTSSDLIDRIEKTRELLLERQPYEGEAEWSEQYGGMEEAAQPREKKEVSTAWSGR